MNNRYVGIRMINNWESISYQIQYEDNITKEKIVRDLVFQDGQQVRIMWPSGAKTRENVMMETYHSSYSDWGRTYNVSGNKPVINASVKGLELKVQDENFAKLKFNLNDLKFDKKGD